MPVDEDDFEFRGSLDQLAHECADGGMDSCDDLYTQADSGSAYEEYGSTCGARTDVAYSGDCATRFD